MIGAYLQCAVRGRFTGGVSLQVRTSQWVKKRERSLYPNIQTHKSKSVESLSPQGRLNRRCTSKSVCCGATHRSTIASSSRTVVRRSSMGFAVAVRSLVGFGQVRAAYRRTDYCSLAFCHKKKLREVGKDGLEQRF